MTDLPTSRIDLKAVLSGTSPTVAKDDHSEGMSYRQSVPLRMVTLYLPLAIPGLISAFIFCFTLCWNEFIYALTFLQSTSNKTVPVAIVNEFVDGDIYRWGSLMAGALAGSLPLVILYAFFVEHYVSAMTGAVKE